MLRRSFKKAENAQILLEYMIVISAVAMILITMNTMLKRGIQAMVKVTAMQIGNQVEADQEFGKAGHLESSYISTRARMDKTRSELFGVTNFIYDDQVIKDSNSVTNLGFTNLYEYVTD
ncbi:MAG: hypothetical protein KAS66_03175 [Candidatus Omnitrophica bacterium]|nr:hypothetical protein [Candidatus Omnitrophota bacterium]